MNKARGFVTVATGNEKYYKMAADLLLSYKTRGQGAYPFAIVCDRENEYTAQFDNVVLVEDFCKGTVDKLLLRYAPYDEIIFLDADTLILKNIDDLWDVFADQDDVSVFGTVLPLDSQNGWFTYEGSGKYKPQIKYLISMNGGIYFARKGALADRVFQSALEVMEEYANIDFKYFSTPQDEPLMAMSLVLNGCKPCDKHYDMIILPAHARKVTADAQGNVYEDGKSSNAKMIHFSARRTELFLYNYLNEVNHCGSGSRKQYWKAKLRYGGKDLKFNTNHKCGAVLRKLGMNSLVDKLKKVLG